MNTIQKSVKILIGISTLLTLVASLISDILMPIAPFALYLGICVFCITIIALVLYIIPKSRNIMAQATSLWFAPIFLSLNISYLILFTTFFYSDKTENQRGVLAENSAFFKSVQEHLHVVSTATKEISKSVASIDRKIDNVKQETSADPRKELANRGVEWSVEGYSDVLNLGDISSIKLFIEGGIDLYAREDSRSIPKLLIIIAKQESGYKEIFEIAMKNNLDLNKRFSTASIPFHKNNYSYDLSQEDFPEYFSASEYLCFLPENFQNEYIELLLKNKIDINTCTEIRKKYIIKTYKKNFNNIKKEISTYEDIINKFNIETKACEKEIQSYKEILAKAEEYKEEIEEVCRQNKNKKICESYRAELDNTYKSYSIAKSKLDFYRSESIRNKKTIEQLKEKLNNIRKHIEEEKKEIEKLEKYRE